MGWSGHQMVDPSDIENRFSNEDAMSNMDSIFTEPDEEALVKIDRVKDMLDLLPAREADFVDLYFFKHLNQTDIASIFGVSQPTVCYRLKRAIERIQFMLKLPAFTEEEISEALSRLGLEEKDSKIMLLMWETTCQSEVAKRIGETQGLVRHRFIRTIKRMEQLEDFKQLAEMFKLISENLVILREVRRPSLEDRWTLVIN